MTDLALRWISTLVFKSGKKAVKKSVKTGFKRHKKVQKKTEKKDSDVENIALTGFKFWQPCLPKKRLLSGCLEDGLRLLKSSPILLLQYKIYLPLLKNRAMLAFRTLIICYKAL